ncbi:hypothetical protein FRB95_006497 [Tulasnella sp. JGI-2019a]|nr:hypothetical protein FRB95_006497 [Tulasnella sp. JGI-2019a]
MLDEIDVKRTRTGALGRDILSGNHAGGFDMGERDIGGWERPEAMPRPMTTMPLLHQFDASDRLQQSVMDENRIEGPIAMVLWETSELKRNFTADLKQAHLKFINAEDAPNFPYNQLDDLLSNQMVNFSKLYTYIYCPAGPETQIAQFSAINITMMTIATRLSWEIESHGQWTIAWTAFKLAIVMT